MRLTKSPRMSNVRDGAEALMRYLEQIPAFVAEHGTTEGFDTTEKLERCQAIASRLRELFDWTGSHRTLTKTRFEEYRRLRDDFEELTGTLSWLPIINLQLSKLRSFRRKRRQVLDTSPFIPPEMIQLRTAAESLLGDLENLHTFPRSEKKRAVRTTIIDGLEDLLSWMQTGQTVVTYTAFNQYRQLRDQYEALTDSMECTSILNYVGKQDDQHQDRLAQEQRAQSLN